MAVRAAGGTGHQRAFCRERSGFRGGTVPDRHGETGFQQCSRQLATHPAQAEHADAKVLPCLAENGEVLVPACSGLAEVLMRERKRIDAALDDLMSARGILDTIIDVAVRAEVEIGV